MGKSDYSSVGYSASKVVTLTEDQYLEGNWQGATQCFKLSSGNYLGYKPSSSNPVSTTGIFLVSEGTGRGDAT